MSVYDILASAYRKDPNSIFSNEQFLPSDSVLDEIWNHIWLESSEDQQLMMVDEATEDNYLYSVALKQFTLNHSDITTKQLKAITQRLFRAEAMFQASKFEDDICRRFAA